MTYSNDPSESAKDLIRFLLQDTQAPFLLQNTEITSVYAMQGNDMARALDTLTTALIAKFASKPYDESVEGLSITYGDMATKYRGLRNDFARMASNGTLPIFGQVLETPTFAGVELAVDYSSNWSHLC